jgi:hypothetical protein
MVPVTVTPAPSWIPVFRTEMMHIAPVIIPVMPVIIVPVVINPLKWLSSYAVGNIAIADRKPRSVIIRGGIPDIPPVEIVTSSEIKKVVRHPDSNIKPQLWRSYKFRRGGDYHGRPGVYWGRGGSDIDPDIDPDVSRMGLGNRHRQGQGKTEQVFFHTDLLSG